MKIVHLLSGGVDSSTLLYELLTKYYPEDITCLGFDYGQKHRKELIGAKEIAQSQGVAFERIELHRIEHLFLRCALTDGGSDSVVVPNRNAVLLNIAASYAMGHGAGEVTFGATVEDYQDFPDCRPQFVHALNALWEAAGVPVKVRAPYLNWTKRSIARRGKELGVPFKLTWSCYAGGEKPCGKCSACNKRQAALKGIYVDSK